MAIHFQKSATPYIHVHMYIYLTSGFHLYKRMGRGDASRQESLLLGQVQEHVLT